MVETVFTDADGRVWGRVGDRQPERVVDAARRVPGAAGYREG